MSRDFLKNVYEYDLLTNYSQTPRKIMITFRIYYIKNYDQKQTKLFWLNKNKPDPHILVT